MQLEKIRVLLTGARGQLGRSFLKVVAQDHRFDVCATDIEELDISNNEEIASIFKSFQPQFCLNTAAYTAVDKAEEEAEIAYRVNAKAPALLAEHCMINNSILFHISTDYVYHSKVKDALKEDDLLEGKGVYAKSKLEGEKNIRSLSKEYVILRTSWLYSEFGHNFVKTMLSLASKGKDLRVVNDQWGAPTYAGDLAKACQYMILKIHGSSNKMPFFGIFNYSNLGEISWYDFALKIFEESGIDIHIAPVPSRDYPSPAPRPLNSRLSKQKIIQAYGLQIPRWDESLKKCLKILSAQENA